MNSVWRMVQFLIILLLIAFALNYFTNFSGQDELKPVSITDMLNESQEILDDAKETSDEAFRCFEDDTKCNRDSCISDCKFTRDYCLEGKVYPERHPCWATYNDCRDECEEKYPS